VWLGGLPHGPTGVAFAYSFVMMLWVVPGTAWAVHGTAISVKDVVMAVTQPLLSGRVAAGLVLGLRFSCGQHLTMFPRLVLEATVLLASYFVMLWYVMGQKLFYMDFSSKHEPPLIGQRNFSLDSWRRTRSVRFRQLGYLFPERCTFMSI
jgi:hypothetical protein